MGFSAISKPATAGGTPTAAGLTALVALARADGASAGDLYQDSDTGRAYRYRTEGAGMLVPDEWYPRISGILEYDTALTDNGPAYLTLADETADLTARGWQLHSSGTGATALTKTADQPLTLDTTPASDRQQFFGNDRTAATAINYWRDDKGVLSIMRVKQTAIEGSNCLGRQRALIFARNGSVDLALCFGMQQTQGRVDIGVGGSSSWSSTPNAQAYSLNRTSLNRPALGSGDGWLLTYLPPASKTSGSFNQRTQLLCERLDVTGESVSMAVDQGMNDSSADSWISAYARSFTSGNRETREIYEWFLYKVI